LLPIASALIDLQVNQPALALDAFQKSIAANPQNHFAYFGAATMYAQADGMTDYAANVSSQRVIHLLAVT
jgi:hypothetical protein